MSKAITPEAARKIIDGIVAERDQAREELARIKGNHGILDQKFWIWVRSIHAKDMNVFTAYVEGHRRGKMEKQS